jgi:hypothetical protein
MAAVEFLGESFELRPKVSEYALLKFARAAAAGEDGDTMEGMASMLRLLEKCIVPADWRRFDRLADEKDATAEQIMDVIKAAFEQVAERPTALPSDSSDGQITTEPKSESNSAVKDSVLSGRPDLQLAVMRAG